MFSLLISDKQLMSPNWLAVAEDPRPDQLPTPVSAPSFTASISLYSIILWLLNLNVPLNFTCPFRDLSILELSNVCVLPESALIRML